MPERLAGPLPDHDNHHNAAVCPYCTHNGAFASVSVADLRRAFFAAEWSTELRALVAEHPDPEMGDY